MSALPNSETKTEFSIHPKTMMGHISLTVANLENQIMFYQQTMGFQLHWRDSNKAGLGAGGPLRGIAPGSAGRGKEAKAVGALGPNPRPAGRPGRGH